MRHASRLLVTIALAGLAATAAPAWAQTGVQLDGTNDFITFGAATATLGSPTFTLECWFKRTGAGVATTTGTGGVTNAVPLLTKGRGEAEGSTVDCNYFLGIRATDSVLVADYEEGTGQTSPGLNHPVTGVTPLRRNVWYHGAATFNGTTWRLFLNGRLEATVVVGAGRLPQWLSIQHAALGGALNSSGVAAGAFAGTIDEARVWAQARPESGIRDSAALELATAPGLLGRWGLDEGSGTTAANSVAGSPAGTLTNGPTWVTGSPFRLADALAFNGTSDYVGFGDPAALDLAQFTVECWFRRDGAGTSVSTGTNGVTAVPMVAHGGPEADGSSVDMNWFLGLRASDHVLVADFEEGAAGAAPGSNHPVAGVTPVTTGTWHHAAATYDGNEWRLYLDGALETSLVVGQPVQSATTQHAALASALRSTGAAQGFFGGALDEVRVWDHARSLAQVQATINDRITVATPGLVGRWGLDEATGTAVGGGAGTGVHGTLAGSGWAWVQGAPFNSLPPALPAAPAGLVAAAPNHQQVHLTWTDGSNNETAFDIERSTVGPDGPFAALASVGADVSGYDDLAVVPSAGYCYRVRARNGLGSSDPAGPACATTPAEPNLALDLAGGTYVDLGDPAALDLPQFTLECWFRRDAAGTPTSTGTGGIATAVPLVTKGRGEAEQSDKDLNWFLGIDATANVLAADFEEGAGGTSPSLNHPVFGATAITDGAWHHAAATYDGTSWRLYLDGRLDATLAVGQPCASASTQRAAIGSALTSTGVAAGFFHGAIDEVRVWDSARGLADLRSTANTPLTVPTAGLVGRWGLNESIGTTVFGSAGTTNHGALVGGAYTRVAGAPFDLDLTPPEVAVTAPNGGESAVVGGSLPLTWIASDAVGVVGVDLLLSRDGVAGPWEPIATGLSNSGSFDWTVTGPSARGSALLRVTAHDAAGNSASDDSDAPFLIDDGTTAALLALFEAEPVTEGVRLRWRLVDPARFPAVTLERAEAIGGPWSPLAAEATLDGDVSTVLDASAAQGRTYYYRLAVRDAGGGVLTFGPLAGTAGVPVTEFALRPVSPNPSQGPVHVTFALPRASDVRLTVCDVQGRELVVLARGERGAGVHQVVWTGGTERGPAAAGAYFVRLSVPGRTFTRTVVLAR